MGISREQLTERVTKWLGEVSPTRGRCTRVEVRSRVTGNIVEEWPIPAKPRITAKTLPACVETLVDAIESTSNAHAESAGGMQRYVVLPYFEKIPGPGGEFPFYIQAGGGQGAALAPYGALGISLMNPDPMATLMGDPALQSGDMSFLGLAALNMRLQYGHNATMIAQSILKEQADTAKQQVLFAALMEELQRLRKENDELRGRYRQIEDQTNALMREQHKREKELLQLKHDLAGKEMVRQKLSDILAVVSSKVMAYLGMGGAPMKGSLSVMSLAAQTLFKGLVDGLDREAIEAIAASLPDTKRMQFFELLEALTAEQSATDAASASAGANGVKESAGAKA